MGNIKFYNLVLNEQINVKLGPPATIKSYSTMVSWLGGALFKEAATQHSRQLKEATILLSTRMDALFAEHCCRYAA